MKRVIGSIATMVMLGLAGYASAGDVYNAVPAGDPQFQQCKDFASKLGWEGGGDASPIAGQSKLEAFCTCMWNETPDDFKGNLATFAEKPEGAKTNKTCEKYANWHS